MQMTERPRRLERCSFSKTISCLHGEQQSKPDSVVVKSKSEIAFRENIALSDRWHTVASKASKQERIPYMYAHNQIESMQCIMYKE